MKFSNLFFLFSLFHYILNQEAAYTNPTTEVNTPDPGVLEHNGYFWAVTTSNYQNKDIFPIRKSKNLVDWEHVGYIFPNSAERPNWATRDFWAPEIHFIDNKFICYFAARNDTGNHVIGAAISQSPEGPWKPIQIPVAEDPTGKMGYIDATYHNGYLIWKYDGNAIGKPTPIVAQKMKPNGIELENSNRTTLIQDTLPWEGGITEAPWIFQPKNQEYIYLFYSGNGYAVQKNGICLYSVGVARSKHLLGPWEKKGPPILKSEINGTMTGPGHCSVLEFKPFSKNERENEPHFYMIYHAWQKGFVGNGNPRKMMTDEISWKCPDQKDENWPCVNGYGFPSDKPKPIPSF